MCLTLILTKAQQKTLGNPPYGSAVSSKQIEKIATKATKDITVYKVLKRTRDGKYISPYLEYTYELGFHYYQKGRDKFAGRINRFYNSYLNIEEGLHSFSTHERAKSKSYFDSNRVVIECIIPKGSLFIQSKDEIVSDNLIVGTKHLEAHGW